MSITYVLDAFALMAYLRDEPGAARVRELLDAAIAQSTYLYLSVVNFGEVVYVSEQVGGRTAAEMAILTLDSLPIETVPVDRPVALIAAHLKAQHRMSYADTFAAALAMSMNAVLVTGDPEFRVLEGLLPIEWIAQRSV